VPRQSNARSIVGLQSQRGVGRMGKDQRVHAPKDPRPPARRVARNTALRAAAEIVGKVASLVLFAYIARELGEATLGDFVFALAVAQIIWAVAGFGLDRMLLRDVAREREPAIDRLFWNMVAFKFSAGLAGVALSVLAVWLLGYSETVQQLVAILGLSFLVVLVSSSPQTVFQAYERMEYYFYAAVPNKILAALFGIGALVLGGGIVAVALGNLAAALLALVLAMLILGWRFARPAPSVHPREWPRLARASAPFGLQEVLGQIIFRMDIVLLSLFTTSAVVGSYGAAYRVLEATLFLAWSIGTSVLPMYSYLEPGDDPPLERVFEGSLKFVVLIMLPIAVVMLVCAEPLVDFLYGLPEFEGAVPVMRWLAFAIVAYGVGHLAGVLVLVRRPGRVTVWAMAAVAAFNVAITLALIGPFDAVGVAAASLATEVVLAATVLVLARPVTPVPNAWRVAGPALVAGAAMAAVMLPVRDELALALPLGGIVYLAVVASIEARRLGGDLAAIRRIVSSRPGPSPVPESGRLEE
jgi:O-antigen/teichoic acid export membrane protein